MTEAKDSFTFSCIKVAEISGKFYHLSHQNNKLNKRMITKPGSLIYSTQKNNFLRTHHVSILPNLGGQVKDLHVLTNKDKKNKLHC